MIRSLEDAWKWYRAVKTLARDMDHLARQCEKPEWQAALNSSNRFRNRTAVDLSDMARTILNDDDLDDVSVLVLFSVFEASVRAQAGMDVDREIEEIRHPAVLQAVNDLKDAIANGSFSKITASYKMIDTDLTERVNQVRKFRNWVAHGRRETPENNVTPDAAFQRLARYLELLREQSSAGAGPPTTPRTLPPDELPEV